MTSRVKITTRPSGYLKVSVASDLEPGNGLAGRFEAGGCFRLQSVRGQMPSRPRRGPIDDQVTIERLDMPRPTHLRAHFLPACILACALALSASTLPASPARAAPEGRIHDLAQQEKAPLLDTLRDLVNIESGSKD